MNKNIHEVRIIEKGNDIVYQQRWNAYRWVRIEKELYDYVVSIFSGTPLEIIVDDNGICNYLKYDTEIDKEVLKYKFDESKTYYYTANIKGNHGIYTCTFKIKNGGFYTTCNCKAGQEKDLCWHRSYILSGNAELLMEFDRQGQLELIEEALKTRGGSNMVEYGRSHFPIKISPKEQKTLDTKPIEKKQQTLVALPKFNARQSIKNMPLWLKIIILIPVGLFLLLFILAFGVALFAEIYDKK